MSKFKIGDKVRVCVGCYVGIPKGTILSVVADGTLGAYWIAGGYAEVGTVNVYHCEFELVEAARGSNETPSLVQKTTTKNDDSCERDSQPRVDKNAWFERKELPPIRTECILVRNSDYVSDGNRCVVLYMGSIYAIVDEGFGEQHYYLKNIDFRPIKTAEEIEAEKREKAITEMVALSPLLDKGWSRRVCADIYDAGYRKMEKK